MHGWLCRYVVGTVLTCTWPLPRGAASQLSQNTRSRYMWCRLGAATSSRRRCCCGGRRVGRDPRRHGQLGNGVLQLSQCLQSAETIEMGQKWARRRAFSLGVVCTGGGGRGAFTRSKRKRRLRRPWLRSYPPPARSMWSSLAVPSSASLSLPSQPPLANPAPGCSCSSLIHCVP